MQPKKHIIIFSHGFGTKKDDRGLLSGTHGIAEALEDEGIETVLFDYNDINEENQVITVRPLRTQVKMLQEVVNENKEKNKDAIIDIIAHSQGCLVVALAKTIGIRKTIFVAPSLDNDIEHTIDMFKGRPGTEINLSGVSKLARKDGTVTIVPAKFWKERKKVEPIPLYNKLCLQTELIIINAKQDEIFGHSKTQGLAEKIEIIELDGNHQFSGEARKNLIKTIKEIIL